MNETIDFHKLEGTGNDFIVVDNRNGENTALIGRASQLCNRHFGVGADGLILLEGSERHDFKMRIINADGSEPQMCGNGVRCFAKYVDDLGLVSGDTFTIETLAGPIVPTLVRENGDVVAVKVDMGAPILRAVDVPVTGCSDERAVDAPITVAGKDYTFTAVSMGNPHAVVFVDDVAAIALSELGPIWETHDRFPERINTEFVQVLDRNTVKMRVWERGAAETMACGTGACAVLVAGVLTGRLETNVTVQLPGGDLSIEWPDESGPVWMTGPVSTVYRGVLGT